MPEGRGGFNEARYKALLEGLEISEILKSNLERTYRIDSEFYSKENLRVVDILSKINVNNITELVKVSDGNHMSISDNFSETGVPYYRGQDIHSYFIEESNPICIDINTFNEPVMKRSHLKEGDVLLSIVGTIGGVSLVSSNSDATCSCKLAIFRPHKTDGYFLSAFLKSKYGQNQITKFTRGAIQMGLILEDMNQILVPSFSNLFQNKTRECIFLAKEKSKSSKIAYSSAETLLLETLGLSNFEPSAEPVNVKGFKESFLSIGRLDAEYYQKKYDEIELKILRSKNGSDILANQIEYIGTGEYSEEYQSKGLGLVPYIRNTNLGKGNIEVDEMFYVDPSNFKTSAKIGEILTSRVGTIGLFGVVKKQQENSVYSDNILAFKLKESFVPEVYALLFSTKFYQLLLEKLAGGSVQPLITQTSLRQLLIPFIEWEVQQKTLKLVEESFHLKKQSERLLETAKRAVEIAIEQNEEVALRYIEEQSK